MFYYLLISFHQTGLISLLKRQDVNEIREDESRVYILSVHAMTLLDLILIPLNVNRAFKALHFGRYFCNLRMIADRLSFSSVDAEVHLIAARVKSRSSESNRFDESQMSTNHSRFDCEFDLHSFSRVVSREAVIDMNELTMSIARISLLYLKGDSFIN